MKEDIDGLRVVVSNSMYRAVSLYIILIGVMGVLDYILWNYWFVEWGYAGAIAMGFFIGGQVAICRDSFTNYIAYLCLNIAIEEKEQHDCSV